MNRVLTKIASIVDIVIFGLLSAGCSLLFGLILSGSSLAYQITGLNIYNVFMGVIVFLIFVIAVVGLVFSIKAVSYARLGYEEYHNKYAILIANIVFNAMFAVIQILFVDNVTLLDVLFFNSLLGCGILYTIDMARNSKALNSSEKTTTAQEEKKEEVEEEPRVMSAKLEATLKKLVELKDRNMITEKEMVALREKFIRREIEKED